MAAGGNGNEEIDFALQRWLPPPPPLCNARVRRTAANSLLIMQLHYYYYYCYCCCCARLCLCARVGRFGAKSSLSLPLLLPPASSSPSGFSGSGRARPFCPSLPSLTPVDAQFRAPRAFRPLTRACAHTHTHIHNGEEIRSCGWYNRAK